MITLDLDLCLYIIDASALLCYLQDEPGADVVGRALTEGAVVTAVNLADALSRMADLGEAADLVLRQWTERGILGQLISVHSVDEASAPEIARLRPATRSLGLSLSDRACLALARRLRLPALTTDRLWKKVHLGVKMQVVR